MPRIILLAVVLAILFLSYESYRRRKKRRSRTGGRNALNEDYSDNMYKYQEAVESGDIDAIQHSGLMLATHPQLELEDIELIYSDVLNLLASHPELKSHALEIGRIKYGFNNPDNELTTYDETAIRNDIMAASN